MTKQQYIKLIKRKYNIDIVDFLDLFKEGKSQRFIAKYFNVTRDIVRYIAKINDLNWTDRNIDIENILNAIRNDTMYNEDVYYETQEHKQYVENYKLKLKISNLQRKLKQLSQEKIFKEMPYDYFLDKLSNYQFPKPNFVSTNNVQSNIDIKYPADILVFSDWHIGDRIDKEQTGKEYNLSVVSDKIQTLIDQISLYRRSDIAYILLLGDFIEGGHVEELLSDEGNIFEYVMFVYEKILFIIEELYKMGYTHIKIGCVVGNHARVKEAKYYKNKYFTFESFIYALLEKQLSRTFEVKFYKNNLGYIEPVKNHIIAFLHGDILKNFKSAQIGKLQSQFHQFYNKNFNSVIMGHYHVPVIQANDWNGYTIVNGSLKGYDEYSLFTNLGVVDPIQLMINIDYDNNYVFHLLKI